MSGDPERSPLRKSPTNLTISFAADTLGWRMPMTLTAELVAGQNAPLHVPHLPRPSHPRLRVRGSCDYGSASSDPRPRDRQHQPFCFHETRHGGTISPGRPPVTCVQNATRVQTAKVSDRPTSSLSTTSVPTPDRATDKRGARTSSAAGTSGARGDRNTSPRPVVPSSRRAGSGLAAFGSRVLWASLTTRAGSRTGPVSLLGATERSPTHISPTSSIMARPANPLTRATVPRPITGCDWRRSTTRPPPSGRPRGVLSGVSVVQGLQPTPQLTASHRAPDRLPHDDSEECEQNRCAR